MTSWMDFTFSPPADTDAGGGIWRKIAGCSGDQVEVHWTSYWSSHFTGVLRLVDGRGRPSLHLFVLVLLRLARKSYH